MNTKINDDDIPEFVHPKVPVAKYTGLGLPECHVTRLFLDGSLHDIWFDAEGIKIGVHSIKWDEIPKKYRNT